MLHAIDLIIGVLRPGLLGLALALAGVAAIDWLVRTRRINPFGRVARVFRTSVDPLLMPVERIVVRAGGLPSSAPWWSLVFVAVAGILLIATLGFVREQLALVFDALNTGPRGVYRLLVSWVFTLIQIAILVRVVQSWVRFRPGAWYARWAYTLSEPILKPIRNVIPLFGGIDVSPLVAWFLLGILETMLLRAW
jgi:YggT family protein